MGTDGRPLKDGNEAFLSSVCEQALRRQEIQWFEKENDDLSGFELDADSVLVLPLVGIGELRGCLVLQSPAALNDHQSKAVLRLFGEHAGASIENALLARKMEQRIKYLSEYDTLTTKLPNRILFKNQLIEAIRRAGENSQLAVLFIDLNDFETVNRKFGHSVGDILLFQVAQRMVEFATDQGLGHIPARMRCMGV